MFYIVLEVKLLESRIRMMKKIDSAATFIGKIIISVVLILFFILCLVGMVLVWFSNWDVSLKIFAFIIALMLGPGFAIIVLVSNHYRRIK